MIDSTRNVRKTVMLSHEEVAEVENYRRVQERIPTESQALAELIRLGLERWREAQMREKRRPQ